jgi:NAD(P)H-hydrate epimerase
MIRLTREQVREVDRLAIQRYHIPGVVLMENAARAATDVAWDMLGARPGRSVLILCGGGNNGGDGLAVARHLHNRGGRVLIYTTIDPHVYDRDALTNWEIVDRMALPRAPRDGINKLIVGGGFELIIDAVFGTGLTTAPRPPFVMLAEACCLSRSPVLAIDIPSGLDCDTGLPLGPCIRATRTVTFVAEKVGFANPEARGCIGQVTVGDIGCPRELIEEVARPKNDED